MSRDVGSVCATLAFERSRSLFAAMLTHGVYNTMVLSLSVAL